MRRIAHAVLFGMALAIAAPTVVATGPAWADPPGGFKHKGKERAEHGRGDRDERSRGDGGTSITVNIGIQDPDRVVIRDYYGDYARGGRCPPGLAKKHNGCLPPGQAKKWALGRPLPRDVVFYDLPPELSVRIAAPPQGYRYVRVAADVLMIAVGTGVVAAAVEDLARM